MTQDQALSILKTGTSVFLTGEAGSGKTYVINQYTKYLREHEVECAVTATTGIAATHIQGMTLHSWSGIGIQSELSDEDLKRLAENKYVSARIKKAKVLIIDEVSMLDGRILSLVERVCRVVKKTGVPFGGLQVVLVGDFFQLPPVVRSTDEQRAQFAFASEGWQSLSPTLCYLSEQHRQEDPAYLEILSAIRHNAFDETHFERLRERMIAREKLPPDVTRLFSHNRNVDSINNTELARLPGVTQVYIMARRGPETLSDTLARGCLSPERLSLKIGATVMFTKNNQSMGFANGTLGTIIGFTKEKKFPIVKTLEGEEIETEPMEWTITEGDTVLAKITQLPLRLAWALTIHKSQGVSLDRAVMDLSQTFEYGQGYVALSRVRSLAGVHLLGVNPRAFEVHPEVLEKNKMFHRASLSAEERWNSLSQSQVQERALNFIRMCGGELGRARKTSGSDTEKKEVNKKGKEFQTLRKKHPQAYRSWTKEEEEKLTKIFHQGMQIKEMAESLGRKPGGIASRLRKLGLKD